MNLFVSQITILHARPGLPWQAGDTPWQIDDGDDPATIYGTVAGTEADAVSAAQSVRGVTEVIVYRGDTPETVWTAPLDFKAWQWELRLELEDAACFPEEVDWDGWHALWEDGLSVSKALQVFLREMPGVAAVHSVSDEKMKVKK